MLVALILALSSNAAGAQSAGAWNAKKASAFKAVDTEGKEVAFPSDYKGRVVMLDFWATWCGPCVGEVPGLVAAYSKYHSKGFEVLGISLDQAGALEKLRSFTKEKGMSWRQVYDGKYWDARIARFYGIRSIPAAFLVDGNTGAILASGDALRGANLERSLASAFSGKK